MTTAIVTVIPKTLSTNPVECKYFKRFTGKFAPDFHQY
jgi:hypothetical protein